MVNDVKDLGVLFDTRLRFSAHIAQVVSKSKQRLFLLFRAFRIREKNPLLRAYKSYILPLLNYCSSVWSPSLLGDIKSIESVQRLFTRRVAGMEYLCYRNRLKQLKLPSLELLRLRADLLLCYKILNGHLAGIPEDYGLRVKKRSSTRGHSNKLFTDHSRVDARRNFFGARIVKPWNSLPSKLVNSVSIASFRYELSGYSRKFLMQRLDD
jgi:hypothetical protein